MSDDPIKNTQWNLYFNGTFAFLRRGFKLSGGQAQRIAIARSLLSKSPLIVLDEPVSALDVIIQEKILQLLKKLKTEFNLSYIFISHDLAVVENFCNKIAVMFHGEFVEIGNTKAFINANKTR